MSIERDNAAAFADWLRGQRKMMRGAGHNEPAQNIVAATILHAGLMLGLTDPAAARDGLRQCESVIAEATDQPAEVVETMLRGVFRG